MADDGAAGRASPPSASRPRRLPLEGRGAQMEWIVGRPLMDGHSSVGTLYTGIVTSVAPYGVFVRVSAGGGQSSTLEGLLHVRYMRGGLDRYISPSSHYARGDDVQVVAIGAKNRYLSFGVLRAGAAIDWDAAVAGSGGGHDDRERRRGKEHSWDGGRTAERGRDRHDTERRRGEHADRRGGSRERGPTRWATAPRQEPEWIVRVRERVAAQRQRSHQWTPGPPHKRGHPSPPRSPGGGYLDHDDRRRAEWDGRTDGGYHWAAAAAADAPPPDGGWPAKRPRGWSSPFSPPPAIAPGAGRGDVGGTPSSAWFEGPAERQGAPFGYPDGGAPRGDYGGPPASFSSAPPPGAYGGLAGAAAGGMAAGGGGGGGGAPLSAPPPYAYGTSAAPFAAAPGAYVQAATAHWQAPTEQWQPPMAAAPRGGAADTVVGGGGADGRGGSGVGHGERPAAGGLPPQQATAAATLWALLSALKAQQAPSADAPPPAAVAVPAQPQADALSALGRLPLDRWLSSQLTAAPAAALPLGAAGAGGGGDAPPRGAVPTTNPGASALTAAAAAPAGSPAPPPLVGSSGPASAGWRPPPSHDAHRGEDAGVL